MKMLSQAEIDAVLGATLAHDAGVAVGGAIANASNAVSDAVSGFTSLLFSKVYAGAVV